MGERGRKIWRGPIICVEQKKKNAIAVGKKIQYDGHNTFQERNGRKFWRLGKQIIKLARTKGKRSWKEKLTRWRGSSALFVYVPTPTTCRSQKILLINQQLFFRERERVCGFKRKAVTFVVVRRGAKKCVYFIWNYENWESFLKAILRMSRKDEWKILNKPSASPEV